MSSTRCICASSKIVLGLNEVNSSPLYFSNRTFLTLACGGFHLTHYVPGLETVFENGRHLVWYHDSAECIELIHQYLADPEARNRVAEAGRELAFERHQYYHRVGRILELLGAVAPRGASNNGASRVAQRATSRAAMGSVASSAAPSSS